MKLDVLCLKAMSDSDIDQKYQMLFDAAVKVLQRNAHPVKHSVGAAVLCDSGQIYTGVNLEASGYGVCAEPIALGAALSNGEKEILRWLPCAIAETDLSFFLRAATVGRRFWITRRKPMLFIWTRAA